MPNRNKDASPQQTYAVLRNLVAEYERHGIETISVKELAKWLSTKQ